MRSVLGFASSASTRRSTAGVGLAEAVGSEAAGGGSASPADLVAETTATPPSTMAPIPASTAKTTSGIGEGRRARGASRACQRLNVGIEDVSAPASAASGGPGTRTRGSSGTDVIWGRA